MKCGKDCAYRVLVKNVSDSPTSEWIAYLPRKRRTMFIVEVSILLDYVVSSPVGA